MALADGDYRVIEEKVVETLLADTAPGGLREGPVPAVAAIRAGDARIAESFGQDEFPAILVRATAKKESPATCAYSVLKSWTVTLTVLDRAMDRAAAEESARKIAARAERVLREQTATDRQFLGLPDLIEGAEGVLVSLLRETVFPETRAESGRVTGSARLEIELQVPCAFRYE